MVLIFHKESCKCKECKEKENIRLGRAIEQSRKLEKEVKENGK